MRANVVETMLKKVDVYAQVCRGGPRGGSQWDTQHMVGLSQQHRPPPPRGLPFDGLVGHARVHKRLLSHGQYLLQGAQGFQCQEDAAGTLHSSFGVVPPCFTLYLLQFMTSL
jgi:hypothetical protein